LANFASSVKFSGLSDYEVTTWFGIFAPAGTPVQIVNKLNYKINEALKKPALISRLEDLAQKLQLEQLKNSRH
jgi:tripartite-type tricarboxylate transporter receptor subunit TctC